MSYKFTIAEKKHLIKKIKIFINDINSILKIVEDIGKYKLQNNVTVFQLKRWLNIIETRKEFGKSLHLDDDFVKKMLQLVHKESIRKQVNIMNEDVTNS